MKLWLAISCLVLLLPSCSEKCKSGGENCLDETPKYEFCKTLFTRWFYNRETGQCEEKDYIGCEEHGFETEIECLECDCD